MLKEILQIKKLIEDASTAMTWTYSDFNKKFSFDFNRIGTDDLGNGVFIIFPKHDWPLTYIIKDINPEVSDDEARVVTFRHIMIKKATEDAYTKILTIQDLLSQGADFDSAAEQYSEDVRTEYTVGRGKLDAGLEDEIFSMEDGEMSIVLESSEGYYIVLCVSSFNREATEQNKKVLLAQKKWEAFEETYNAFARKQTCEFKEKRWEEIHLDGQDISGTKFYDIYENYF